MGSLESELAEVLNRHSCENASNTPDYVLAQYLLSCLAAFDVATRARERHYGVQLQPGRVLVNDGVQLSTKTVVP